MLWIARRGTILARQEASLGTRMDHRLDWILQKGVLAVALYFAIVGDVAWLQPAVSAVVWGTLALSVWVIPQRSPSGRMAGSQAATMAFDLAVLASMFLAHWYWTAFAYAVCCGCLALAHARAASKP